MSTTHPVPHATKDTCVDEVRRVRKKLSEETGNDINRLADRARKTTEALRDKLGLEPARR